jgi:hypothetical protein
VPLLPTLDCVLRERASKGANDDVVALAEAMSVAPFLRSLVPWLRITSRVPHKNATWLNCSGTPHEQSFVTRLLDKYTDVWFGATPLPHLGLQQQRHTVLIKRQGAGSREFEDGTYQRLSAALAWTRSALRVYVGTERLLDVLTIFHSAESIVGYHGAGFANAVFSRHACAHELTTFKTLRNDISKENIWRSNMERVLIHTTKLSWHIHLIPLEQMVMANANWLTATSPHWNETLRLHRERGADWSFGGQIKLPYISLTDSQIRSLIKRVQSCGHGSRGEAIFAEQRPSHSRELLL